MRGTGILAAALVLLVVTPIADAGRIREPPIAFRAVSDSLTLDACDRPATLMALLAAPARSLDRGETRLLDETMADPLALLELEDVPTALLGRLTVRQLGPIYGARTADVPQDTALAAIALDGAPIHADDLRSYDIFASVRQEPSDAQREDLAALLSHG